MSEAKPRRPGDFILDRYFKDADEETRERARDVFAEFARILEELGAEVLARAGDIDSRELPSRGTIPQTPSL